MSERMSREEFEARRDDSGNHIVPMRLQRFLARAGVASRRGSENLMTAGRVCVNGVVASELGTKVDPLKDVVTVDGRVVRLADEYAYLMLNKPAGYITTMSDPFKSKCVADLMPRDRYPGLFAVGRLDKDTTGLLLLTTDGDAAQALLHPSRHVDKHYVALVEGFVSDSELKPLREGIELDDGPCQPAEAEVIPWDDPRAKAVSPKGKEPGRSVVGIRLREGRTHQVKRMMRTIHHPVVRLHRDTFGPLVLGDVDEGSWRHLTDAERDALLKSIGRT